MNKLNTRLEKAVAEPGCSVATMMHVDVGAGAALLPGKLLQTQRCKFGFFWWF